jgi:MFS family permease
VRITEDRAGRWRLTVCGLGVVTIVAYGVAYYSYGVLIDPIRASTGWSSPALGAVFSGVLVIGGAGALAGGRLVDRLGTRPAFLLAGTVGAGAVAATSYQHDLPAFGVLYAVGCGVITALGFYNITQPAAIRAAGDEPARAVVWLTVIGAFSSPIFLPVTAALVDGVGWRVTIRVLAAIAAATFLITAALQRVESAHVRARRAVVGVPDALRDAWKAPGFPRWVLASLISGAAVDIILVYQVPVMIAAGLPIGAAATIGGIRGFAQLGGRLPLSPLLRRLGTRRTIVLSLIVATAGTLLLLASGDRPGNCGNPVWRHRVLRRRRLGDRRRTRHRGGADEHGEATATALRPRGQSLGDGCVVELVDKLSDQAGDLIAGRADLVKRAALGIGQVPVDVALAGDERARVAAAHRHDNIGLDGELGREPLRASVRQVDPELAHDLHDGWMHPPVRVGFATGRQRVMSAVRRAVK